MARTDNDSWDLASGVGVTARIAAGWRALATREGLINDPFAAPLVRAVGEDFFTRVLDGDIDLSVLDPARNMRRSAEGMAVRTRNFDRMFGDAAAEGVRQAVILAAGLDARAYRLPWPDATVVYEIDQPEVIEFKTNTLAGLGAEPTAIRRAVGIDLRADWPKALVDNGFDRSRATAWSTEGLLIYLSPRAQDLLFDNITKLSAPGSQLATEYIPDMADFHDGRSQALTQRVKRLGDDVDFSGLVYGGERRDIIEYLTALGWEVSAQKITDAYAANGFRYPQDEAMQRFANFSYLSATFV